ncbi:MAG: hypothetical protein OXU48_02505 [candidate division Zixibacteria bacterium]|nr:hypothetical protein [candidate division Zixibacteria bacterium]
MPENISVWIVVVGVLTALWIFIFKFIAPFVDRMTMREVRLSKIERDIENLTAKIDLIYDASDLVGSGGSGAARASSASRGPVARATYPVGRPTRVEQNTDADAAAEVTATYAYDHEGRVTRRRVSIDTLPAKDVFYRYDLAGKATAMVYPDGSEVRYTCDASGRLAGVTDAKGNALATYAYDHDGRMSSHAVGGTLATGAYAYDDNGKITRVATGSDTATYAYTRASTPNRLDSITEGAKIDRFVYDANGSATSVAGNALTYDHRGLVTGYGAYGYTLDAERYRVKKTGDGSTVYYVRGDGGSVLATYDGSPFRFTGHERDAESGLDDMRYSSYAYDRSS